MPFYWWFLKIFSALWQNKCPFTYKTIFDAVLLANLKILIRTSLSFAFKNQSALKKHKRKSGTWICTKVHGRAVIIKGGKHVLSVFSSCDGNICPALNSLPLFSFSSGSGTPFPFPFMQNTVHNRSNSKIPPQYAPRGKASCPSAILQYNRPQRYRDNNLPRRISPSSPRIRIPHTRIR